MLQEKLGWQLQVASYVIILVIVSEFFKSFARCFSNVAEVMAMLVGCGELIEKDKYLLLLKEIHFVCYSGIAGVNLKPKSYAYTW